MVIGYNKINVMLQRSPECGLTQHRRPLLQRLHSPLHRTKTCKVFYTTQAQTARNITVDALPSSLMVRHTHAAYPVHVSSSNMAAVFSASMSPSSPSSPSSI